MKYIFTILFCLLICLPAKANGLPDADNDGVPDQDEVNIFHTDPNNPDSDNDGFKDRDEIINGYNALVPMEKDPKYHNLLKKKDTDSDGVSDYDEIFIYLTDPQIADTDSDGFTDSEEIKSGFDPLDSKNKNKAKYIKIDLKSQTLSYYLGKSKAINTYKISSGKRSMPTPSGKFVIGNKSRKAWSKTYGLWMPYWLGLRGQNFGLHELPYWPNGYREGESHLGTPVSHGCVRLGIGPAKTLFDWTEVGTPVIIE